MWKLILFLIIGLVVIVSVSYGIYYLAFRNSIPIKQVENVAGDVGDAVGDAAGAVGDAVGSGSSNKQSETGICFGISGIAKTKKQCTELGGRWDTPCTKNSHCPYYKANRNYPNTSGDCMAGYCRMPFGAETGNRTFRLASSTQKPKCYNCKSGESGAGSWGYCCEAQKSAIEKRQGGVKGYCAIDNLYECLSTPDYAYPGDEIDRKNYKEWPKGISWDSKGSGAITSQLRQKWSIGESPCNTLSNSKARNLYVVDTSTEGKPHTRFFTAGQLGDNVQTQETASTKQCVDFIAVPGEKNTYWIQDIQRAKDGKADCYLAPAGSCSGTGSVISIQDRVGKFWTTQDDDASKWIITSN